MLNLEDLDQFVAFHKKGRLSAVAEDFHISQPTITRTMKRIEEAFGLSLFVRSANRLEFTETGHVAVKYAEDILAYVDQAVSAVQAFDAKLHTFVVESCAPAPIWTLLPKVNAYYTGKTISSQICDIEQIEKDIIIGKCDVGILPHPMNEDSIESVPFLKEELTVCVPKGHELSSFSQVSARQLNGYNYFLASDIGFWHRFCDLLPSSRFLIQKDEFAFQELIQNSSLLCFSSTLVDTNTERFKDRVLIPIQDEEARATFYLVYPKSNTSLFFLKSMRISSTLD